MFFAGKPCHVFRNPAPSDAPCFACPVRHLWPATSVFGLTSKVRPHEWLCPAGRSAASQCGVRTATHHSYLMTLGMPGARATRVLERTRAIVISDRHGWMLCSFPCPSPHVHSSRWWRTSFCVFATIAVARRYLCLVKRGHRTIIAPSRAPRPTNSQAQHSVFMPDVGRAIVEVCWWVRVVKKPGMSWGGGAGSKAAAHIRRLFGRRTHGEASKCRPRHRDVENYPGGVTPCVWDQDPQQAAQRWYAGFTESQQSKWVRDHRCRPQTWWDIANHGGQLYSAR